MDDTAVLERPNRVTCRPQHDFWLLYNSGTDELHVVSTAGFSLYQQCDGLHSIAEVAARYPTGSGRLEAIRNFLSQLTDRGLLEQVA